MKTTVFESILYMRNYVNDFLTCYHLLSYDMPEYFLGLLSVATYSECPRVFLYFSSTLCRTFTPISTRRSATCVEVMSCFPPIIGLSSIVLSENGDLNSMGFGVLYPHPFSNLLVL